MAYWVGSRNEGVVTCALVTVTPSHIRTPRSRPPLERARGRRPRVFPRICEDGTLSLRYYALSGPFGTAGKSRRR
eukprot:3821860-Rhodomonas_salina.1